jgi:carboxymethylenebutenolidase
MTGGRGAREVRHFYSGTSLVGTHRTPPVVPLTRTVGQARIVDELTCQFTPTIEMPWMLPGVAPNGRRAEGPTVVVVFVDGRISGERIYWDQASLLAQLGVLDDEQLPATGIEAARKVRDPTQAPSNALITRTSGPRE